MAGPTGGGCSKGYWRDWAEASAPAGAANGRDIMFGKPGLGLAILALPGAVGACHAAGSTAPAAAAAAADERCPAPGWGADADGVRLPVEPVWNRVSLDRHGAIHWNGTPI